MKIRQIVKAKGLVGLFLPFYLFTFLPLPASAQKLEAEKMIIDVGRTGYQMPVTATFEFKNKSHRHLKISTT